MRFVLLIIFIVSSLLTAEAQKPKGFKITYRYVRQDGRKGRVELKHVNDTLNLIRYYIGGKLSDEWRLDCPVYNFECGDLTGNGVPEITVGVIKSARYSRYVSKRLFIFKLYDERYVRPLWLGSRMAHDLIDYHLDISADGRFIDTTERTMKGDTLQLRYRTAAFGLKFVEYKQLVSEK